MAKLDFHELINFFWNRDDFSVVSARPSKAYIYKNGDDRDPYYMLIEADGDLVESIDFYVIKMQHMEKVKADSVWSYVKAFSFDVCDIESIEHLVDVCKNTFKQMVVEEIDYLQQQMNKMNKLLID